MGCCDWLCGRPNGFPNTKSSSTCVLLCFVISLLLIHKGGGEECGSPLGMESGKISTSQITASSAFDLKSVGPQNARIRQELVSGAWCPKSVIQDGVREFIEVDFQAEHRITATETQGRFGNGVGREFAEKVTFEYWRPQLGKWVQYRDSRGRTIFDGNINTYTGVKQEFIPPIFATKLRFIPHSIHPRVVCMRVEVYGCLNEDGILSYDVPQGYYTTLKGEDYEEQHFRDSLYDGQVLIQQHTNPHNSSKTIPNPHQLLSGGRGILTDTILGSPDFTQTKANGWMGWVNESTPIKIQFHFDQLRKFEAVKVHVSNLVQHQAQTFTSLTIFSSVDGGNKLYKNPIVWIPQKNQTHKEDVLMEQVPLKGLIASFILLEFVHSNKWLLISEISFVSVPVHNHSAVHSEILHSQDSLRDQTDDTGHISSPFSTIVGVVIGCVSVCLVLSTTLAICFLRRRNGRTTKLIGILGIPTPKSMSVGNGLNNTNSTTSGSSTGHISTISGNTSIANDTLVFGKKHLQHDERSNRINVSKFKPGTIQGDNRKISLLNDTSKSRERLDSDPEMFQDIRSSESAVGKYNNSRNSSGLRAFNGSKALNSCSLNCVPGPNGSVTSSCATTAKTPESDSSSSSGYASTFSQQLRRKSSGDEGWRNRQLHFSFQQTVKGPDSSLLPKNNPHKRLGDCNPGSTGEITGSSSYYRHLSTRLHPNLTPSVSSPLRTPTLTYAQAPTYSPTPSRRLILPHDYSNASTVSYSSKLNFPQYSNTPDVLSRDPTSHRLPIFLSPQRNHKTKPTISRDLLHRDTSFRNPHPTDEYPRDASSFYPRDLRDSNKHRSASENGFYAVSDVLQSTSYPERRF